MSIITNIGKRETESLSSSSIGTIAYSKTKRQDKSRKKMITLSKRMNSTNIVPNERKANLRNNFTYLTTVNDQCKPPKGRASLK